MVLPQETPQANIALMQRAFDALNRRDLDQCVALMTPDFKINLAGVPYEMRGPETWRLGVDVLHAAFPDAVASVEDIFASQDRVAVRMRITGTHRGSFQGVPPSGAPIDYVSNEIYRISDGKIAEEWICSDMLTLMTQIGALPVDH